MAGDWRSACVLLCSERQTLDATCWVRLHRSGPIRLREPRNRLGGGQSSAGQLARSRLVSDRPRSTVRRFSASWRFVSSSMPDTDGAPPNQPPIDIKRQLELVGRRGCEELRELDESAPVLLRGRDEHAACDEPTRATHGRRDSAGPSASGTSSRGRPVAVPGLRRMQGQGPDRPRLTGCLRRVASPRPNSKAPLVRAEGSSHAIGMSPTRSHNAMAAGG